MPKSIHHYLKKLEKSSKTSHPHPKLINTVLSGCRHTKTISFAFENDYHQNHSHGATSAGNRVDEAATLADVDRFLLENFSSLFREEMTNNEYESKKQNEDHNSNGFLFESPRLLQEPPKINRSDRFFVSTGSSSSLMEETRLSDSVFEEFGSSSTQSRRESTEIKGGNLPEDSIAVLRSSPNPYEEFRGSMEEMIEARLIQKQTVDWEFMEELLFCYLRLNDKTSYKFILKAFVDLTGSSRPNFERNQGKVRKIPIAGERMRRRRRKKVDVTSDSGK